MANNAVVRRSKMAARGRSKAWKPFQLADPSCKALIGVSSNVWAPNPRSGRNGYSRRLSGLP
jgi:hypothetical protein